jgi:hypothetical protein
MSELEGAGLFVALAAPALAVLVVVLGRSPWAEHRTLQTGAMVSAAAWVVVLLAGASGRVALLHLTPLVAAGGCGAAVVAGAILDRERVSRRSLVGTGVALALVCLALAGGRQGVHVVALAGGLALAAIVAVDAAPPEDRTAPALLALLATLAALVGTGALLVGDDRWDLPETGTVSVSAVVALVGAAAAWTLAGTARHRRSTALLLPGGLVLGLAAAPLRGGDDDVAMLAVVLGAAAVAAAFAGRGSMALGLLALAAASASPGLAPSSRLLAAAAVLVVACGDRPVALLAALPGGVALAAEVIQDGEWPAAVVAVAGIALAALLGRTVLVLGGGGPTLGPATRGLVPAALAGAWLVVLPGSWAWTGAELGHYDRGMTRGLAAAVVAVAVATLAPRLDLPHRGGRRRHPP